MMRRALQLLTLGVVFALFAPSTVRAGLSSLDNVSESNSVEAREYRLRDRRVAGNESLRQNITAWRVTQGKWNGESIGGLSLVLVETASDNGQLTSTTNCYVSHLATAAQRDALVSAFVASQGLSISDVSNWRVEPSMIRIEINGQTVIIHLGLVA
jgi:hypothetical protein